MTTDEHPTHERTEALVNTLHRLELAAWQEAQICDQRSEQATTAAGEQTWKIAARRERAVAAAYANAAFLVRSYR